MLLIQALETSLLSKWAKIRQKTLGALLGNFKQKCALTKAS